MKKILLIMGILLSSLGANAQINAGTMMAGGSASFNNRVPKGDFPSVKNLTIQPQFGIAVADNFLVGGFLGVYAHKNYTYWSASPFLRYYVKNFFVQGGYGYSFSKLTQTTTSGSIIDFELGYAAFLNKNIALEPAFYYNGVFNGKQYHYSDFGIKIGFQIYFNR